jgi:ParB family transcriptional regulator, chromosome partitioning protein
MQFKIKNVTLDHIDSGDEVYRVTTNENTADLVASFAHVGLVNPPLLIKNNSNYTIVCGFRRISAYRCLELNSITARILAQNTKKFDCATYAIVDNAYQRPLNLVEISRAINLLDRFMDKTKQTEIKLEAMGLPENKSLIKKIKKIDRLPMALKNAIVSNVLSLSMALELGKLDKKTGIAFTQLFADLKLGLNKQREIFTLVNEIAHRDGLPMMAVIKAPELQVILNDNHFDRNQRAQKIREYLKQVRFPIITTAEQAFKAHLKTLNLSANAKLIPPENFESTMYTLKLTFSRISELHDHKLRFDALIENPVIQKILS